MSPLKPDDFGEFFRAVNGNEPFPWQRRLAARVCTGAWPKALALPTASGKTACLDIALFALACQSSRPAAERTAPRRIAFVVDRRVIVDEAFERARKIARCLRTGRDLNGVGRPIVARVATALRAVGALSDDDDPLVCAQLRGGIYRDPSWAADPAQPTILASTVDQIGSRMLFRGYGVSDSLKPVHAGLVANDCLILLDEAHCARPFARTAAAVGEYRRWCEGGIPALPFHFVILSATPPPGFDDDVVRLEANDLEPDALGPRVTCCKTVELIPEEVSGGAKGLEKFATRLVDHAGRMVEKHGLRAIAIMVNRVNTARKVDEICRKRWPKSRAEVVCFTGRMRPFDRDKLVSEWGPRLRADKNRPPLEKPVFVIATQCLEVGANLDFEGMVTECASLDALRQRFGRLKRLGLGPEARGVILIRADQVKTEDELAKEPLAKKDPIYDDALPRTWNWLWDHATITPGDDGKEQRVIDFGIAALDRILPARSEEVKPLQAPSGDAPIMLPSHVDCWVQTRPQPSPDPDVSLFLHGPERGEGDVRVCWRADLNINLPDDTRGEQWTDAVAFCPPSAAECMSVPMRIIREWLRQDPMAPPPDDNASDLEHAMVSEAPSRGEESGVQRRVLRWCGPDDPDTRLLEHPNELRPGDTLIVPAQEPWARTLGQLPDGTGWDLDIAEPTTRLARRRAILRLLPDRLRSWPECPDRETLTRIVSDDGDIDLEVTAGELRQALRDLSDHPKFPQPLRDLVRELTIDRRIAIHRHPGHPSNAPDNLSPDERGKQYPGGLVLMRAKLLPPVGDEPTLIEAVTTEDDTSSATVSVPLESHSQGVAELVDRYGMCFGLPESLRLALTGAARWHDLGKADPRFQAWLHNGNAQVARVAPKLLAKSGGLPQSASEREKARARSGYPRGARHELVSVKLAEGLLDRLDASVDRDLVLHLIACHHGHARPLVPVVDDNDPVDVRLAFDGVDLLASSATMLHRLDSGVAERFWSLVRRYGWWRLAWLEVLLRLADHRRSRFEQEELS